MRVFAYQLQTLVHSQDQVRVLDSYGIQMSEIDTKS